MKVTNRSMSTVDYELREINVARSFTPTEVKDVPQKELTMLAQQVGGADLIRNFLLVDDEKWVSENLGEQPIEYFWTLEDIKKCVQEDNAELFEETLNFAPEGVIDLIKDLSWRLPLSDLNKVEALKRVTGFDAIFAHDAMAEPTKKIKVHGERLRKK